MAVNSSDRPMYLTDWRARMNQLERLRLLLLVVPLRLATTFNCDKIVGNQLTVDRRPALTAYPRSIEAARTVQRRAARRGVRT